MPFNGLVPMLSAMELPSEIAFTIGSITVYWQGLLLACAMIGAILFTIAMSKYKGLPSDTAVDLCLVMLPCAFIGARIWFVLSHYELYANSILSALRFWDGGLTIYGAAIFAALGLFVYSLKTKTSLSRLLDALAPGLVFALSLLLWGDFIDQTGYGPQITNPNAMWFPFAVLIAKTDTIHCAVFFYEFIWLWAIFALDWFYLRKRAKRDGDLFLVSMLLYCGGHAVFNLLRIDAAKAFDVPQLISVLLAVFAAVLLIFRYHKPIPYTDGDKQTPECDNKVVDEKSPSVVQVNAPEPADNHDGDESAASPIIKDLNEIDQDPTTSDAGESAPESVAEQTNEN